MIFIRIFIAQNNKMASPRLEIQKNSDTRYPEFSEINPRSIGFYSIDDKVGYSPTANNLKYLRRDPDGWLNRNRNFNLGRGLDTYIRKSSNATGNDDKIDYLLRWIMENNFLRKIQEENAVDFSAPIIPLLRAIIFLKFLSWLKNNTILLFRGKNAILFVSGGYSKQ